MSRTIEAAALLKAGALHRAIFDSAHFSCIATDAEGVIQIFNVGAEHMLGYAASEVINHITPAGLSDPAEVIERARNLSAEQDETITPGFDALVFKARRTIEDIYELTYIRKDGTRCPAVVSVTALRGPDDAIIGYLLIGTDNTARKRVEEERSRLEHTLQQKNDELESASRMKSEFLANMSHELRTPLNAIIGFSEALRDGLVGPLTDKQRGFIADIYGSGRHLLALINDILDLSKVEAGAMVLDLEPINVSTLLVGSVSVVRETASARGIRVLLHAPDAAWTLEADVRKVRQILYNLLSNAVKFTNDGGQVVIDARIVPAGDVGRLTADRAGRTFARPENDFAHFLAIGVSDSGIGISPEGMESLFAPFSQIDSGLSRRFGGTGLGLTMVKMLAELHGGTVSVESAPHEGSRFTAWLPLRGVPITSAALRAPDVVPPPHAGRTALVVEDDFNSAELMRLQLEAEGFTVLHAPSAEQALLMAVEQPLALITLDIMLPDMDGWEFLSRIKQIESLRRVPVVIASVVADRNKGFALGAAAVIEKPISREELYESLVDLGLFPQSDGGTLRVLVIDDDPKSVELIALRIVGLASLVLRASGGREGIEMARRECPDLIVLDLMMPDVNGFEVVAALNADASTAQIPVLIVTAKRITADDRAHLTGHVTAIMEKAEFDGARFTAEVRRAMSGRTAMNRSAMNRSAMSRAEP
jgi:signal transduction histidine kinase/DNA-binding response OmpR family regulator